MNRETRKIRLERVRRLRAMNAPRWEIRNEQMAMLLLRENLKVAPIGKRMSKRQRELYVKFVLPHIMTEYVRRVCKEK
jgi:hypothetical protein